MALSFVSSFCSFFIRQKKLSFFQRFVHLLGATLPASLTPVDLVVILLPYSDLADPNQPSDLVHYVEKATTN